MNLWRYQTCEQVLIDAPIEEVYSVASNPEIVPRYAPEIARIEIVERLSEHLVLVKSYLKIGGFRRAYLYRYHYRPPTNYSGIQEGGKFLRGYFNLSFRAQDQRTIVSHTEGILSVVPCLAWVVGSIYFRLMAPDGIKDELGKLKELAENYSV